VAVGVVIALAFAALVAYYYRSRQGTRAGPADPYADEHPANTGRPRSLRSSRRAAAQTTANPTFSAPAELGAASSSVYAEPDARQPSLYDSGLVPGARQSMIETHAYEDLDGAAAVVPEYEEPGAPGGGGGAAAAGSPHYAEPGASPHDPLPAMPYSSLGGAAVQYGAVGAQPAGSFGFAGAEDDDLDV